MESTGKCWRHPGTLKDPSRAVFSKHHVAVETRKDSVKAKVQRNTLHLLPAECSTAHWTVTALPVTSPRVTYQSSLLPLTFPSPVFHSYCNVYLTHPPRQLPGYPVHSFQTPFFNRSHWADLGLLLSPFIWRAISSP